MKDLLDNLWNSILEMRDATFEFVRCFLVMMIYLICLPFYPLWVLKRTFQIDVWYKYHFTQYYQKNINPKTIKKIFEVCADNRDKSLERENERKWATKIIKRYRSYLSLSKSNSDRLIV